ncbi:MAG: SHOCT domain-containing protein [Woeseiaceae bacterium]|nr:SHOCT domain-containing protein [Woeseiaceae bacterium]
MKKILIATLLVACFALSPAEAARINSLENLVIPERTDGSRFTLEEVQALIMQGCTRRQWTPEYEGDSVITCSILVRGRHFVKVEIPFNELDYSILYRDSDQMDYNEAKQTIHRKYNGWVNNLQAMIARQFQDAVGKPAGTSAIAEPAKSEDAERYEALLKLGELRDKGLISDEEFEAEKQKLLNAE